MLQKQQGSHPRRIKNNGREGAQGQPLTRDTMASDKVYPIEMKGPFKILDKHSPAA